MSAAQELLIMIDEQDPAFEFKGSWTTSNGPWYHSRCLYGSEGDFALSFNGQRLVKGSSVAFVGNTPPRSDSGAPFTHTVTIDGESTYNDTFPLPDPSDLRVQQGYQQWYTSPMLSDDTPHNITISDGHGVAVDFAIVTITNPDTPISKAQMVLVDDEDPAVRYTGDWKNTMDSQFLSYNPFPGGYPVMNSTHQSQGAEDCLEFRFAGTAIEVYGVWFPPSRDSTKISLRVTLDGTIAQRDPVIARQSERYQNMLLFAAGDLLPTDHTLTMSADDTSRLWIIDYIVYSPSFTSMRDMPDLSKGYKGCVNVDPGSSIRVGMIVGVVLGLFAFALLTIIGVWRWNKWRYRRIQLRRLSTSPETAYAPLQTPDQFEPSKDVKLSPLQGDAVPEAPVAPIQSIHHNAQSS